MVGILIGAWMGIVVALLAIIAYSTSYEAQTLGGGQRLLAQAILVWSFYAGAAGAVVGGIVGGVTERQSAGVSGT